MKQLEETRNRLESLELNKRVQAMDTAAEPALKEMSNWGQLPDPIDRQRLEELRPASWAVFRAPRGAKEIQTPNFID
jgi:hypothetical protein